MASISIGKILRESAKFNMVRIFSLIIQPPTQLAIGIFLSPRDYGVVSLVGLWSLYAGLTNPGVLLAAKREIPFLIAGGRHEEAARVQNVGISANLVYSILPLLVICGSALLYSDRMIRIGLIITAFAYLAGNAAGYWSGINFIRQKFTVVAIGRLLGSISVFIVIVGLGYWFGVYAVIAAPLIASVFTILYFIWRGPIDFEFVLDRNEIIRLMKVGLILSLSGILFYGYRLTDRTIIASLLTLEELGLFAFAMVFVSYGINFFDDFTRVLEPILWEHSGKFEHSERSFFDTQRIAIYMALATGISVPIAQVIFTAMIAGFVPRYLEAIPLFYVLSNLLFLFCMTGVPLAVLQSVVVNKQGLVSIVFALGVLTNGILDLLMVSLGYGVTGIVLVTIVSQGLVTLSFYVLAWQYMAERSTQTAKVGALLVLPLLVCVLFSLVHQHLTSSGMQGFGSFAISLGVQLLTWTLVIRVFYRSYVPPGILRRVARIT